MCYDHWSIKLVVNFISKHKMFKSIWYRLIFVYFLRSDTKYQILIKKPILSDTLTDTIIIGASLITCNYSYHFGENFKNPSSLLERNYLQNKISGD